MKPWETHKFLLLFSRARTGISCARDSHESIPPPRCVKHWEHFSFVSNCVINRAIEHGFKNNRFSFLFILELDRQSYEVACKISAKLVEYERIRSITLKTVSRIVSMAVAILESLTTEWGLETTNFNKKVKKFVKIMQFRIWLKIDLNEGSCIFIFISLRLLAFSCCISFRDKIIFPNIGTEKGTRNWRLFLTWWLFEKFITENQARIIHSRESWSKKNSSVGQFIAWKSTAYDAIHRWILHE